MEREIERIKAYFITPEDVKKNTASYNRKLMIIKMASYAFDNQIITIKASNSKSKYFKALRRYLLYFSTCLKLPKQHKGAGAVFFLLSSDPILTLIVFLALKWKGIKIVNERNEFPRFFRENMKIIALLNRFFVQWWQYRVLDALFVMTDILMEYYQPLLKKTACIFKLPMTIDVKRFSDVEAKETGQEYLFYAGGLDDYKDGVLKLLDAFADISANYEGLQLWIAGGGTAAQNEALKKRIEGYALEKKVKLLGLIDRDSIPKYMRGAKILLMPRPDSVQAQGGFPTKLGEYLASQRPVVVTNIGEIPNYLDDSDVSFVDAKNIEEGVVYAVKGILENYDNAIVKARRASEKAKALFGVEANAQVLADNIKVMFR